MQLIKIHPGNRVCTQQTVLVEAQELAVLKLDITKSSVVVKSELSKQGATRFIGRFNISMDSMNTQSFKRIAKNGWQSFGQ